jgi:Uma2 family endonuclease
MQPHAPDIAFKHPPRTAMEVFEMLPEGTLVEVIDNAIHVRPMPSVEHQDILGCICAACFIHIKALKLGKCLTALMDVYLSDKNIVQPDLLFISTANLGIIKEGKIKGTPDLIVEILSGNRKYDTKTKKELYETFGVKEYFIVDPDTKEVIAYYHDGSRYIKQESKKGKIISKLLGGEFEF